jgi:phosphate transport system permease protein
MVGGGSDGRLLGWAGRCRAGIIVIPVVVRTTEDMLRLVPGPLREAGLGARPAASVVIKRIAWRAAPASSPASCWRLARIAGETAPLLFTALSNQFFSLDLSPRRWPTCR